MPRLLLHHEQVVAELPVQVVILLPYRRHLFLKIVHEAEKLRVLLNLSRLLRVFIRASYILIIDIILIVSTVDICLERLLLRKLLLLLLLILRLISNQFHSRGSLIQIVPDRVQLIQKSQELLPHLNLLLTLM